MSWLGQVMRQMLVDLSTSSPDIITLLGASLTRERVLCSCF